MLRVGFPPFKLSEYTNEDSEGNAILKTHAYFAANAGWVSAYVQMAAHTDDLQVYVGATNDPAGAGDLIQAIRPRVTTVIDQPISVSAFVAKGEYFEIISDDGTPTIRWKSCGPLLKPVDFN